MPDQAPFDFADGKDPQAFRTIGEVAHAFGLKQHVLRYWEEQFPQLRPLKRSGGRRYYRPEDVALVAEINHLLYAEGFTIRGARQALGGRAGRKGTDVVARGPGDDPVSPEASGDMPSDVATRLRQVRETLANALQQS